MSAEVSSHLAVINDCEMVQSSLSSDYAFVNMENMHQHLDNLGAMDEPAGSAPGIDNSGHATGPRPLNLKSLDIFRHDNHERQSLNLADSSRDYPDYISTATVHESLFSQPSHILKASSGRASMKKRVSDPPHKTLDQLLSNSRTGASSFHLASSGSLKKLSRPGTSKSSQGTTPTPLSSPKRGSPSKGSFMASPKSPFHPPGYHTARRAELRALLERQKCEQELLEESKMDRHRLFDKYDQKCGSHTLSDAGLVTDNDLSMLAHSMESTSVSTRHPILKGPDFTRSKLQESPRSGSIDQRPINHSPGESFRDPVPQRMKTSPAGSKECRSPLTDRATFSSPSIRRLEATMTTVKESNEQSGDENSSDYGTVSHHRSKDASSMSLDAGVGTPSSFISGQIPSPEISSMNGPKEYPSDPIIIASGQPLFISDPQNGNDIVDQVKMDNQTTTPLDLHPYRDHTGVRLQGISSLLCHQPVSFSMGGVYNSDFTTRAPPTFGNMIQPQMKQPTPVKMEGYIPFPQKPISGYFDPHNMYPAKPVLRDMKVSRINLPKEHGFNPHAASYIPMNTSMVVSNVSRDRQTKVPPVICNRISSMLKPGNITVLHTQNGYTFKSYFCPDSKRVNCKLAGIERNPYANCRAENWDLFARNALGTHATRPLNRTISSEEDLIFVSRAGTCVYSSRFAHSNVNICVDYNGKKFAIVEFDD